MRVAVLYNARPAQAPEGLPDDWFEEYDTEQTVARIGAALSAGGVTVLKPVLADRTLPRVLEQGGIDFIFNMAEGQGRRCREAIPAAVCELMGVPYTGSDALTLAVTLDKAMAKRIVSPDVPVPQGVVVQHERDYAALKDLRYPVLAKPNDEGSSKGIRGNPIATDDGGAAERCQWLIEQYGCPVLVEEFLSGPEITVGVVGNRPDARILGMMEIAPAKSEPGPFVYSLEVKRDWRRLVQYFVPPRVDERTRSSLERLAVRAFDLLGCRDFARMDFRLDGHGKPHFMECNPLPGLNPDSADMVLLSRGTLSYEALIQGILRDATTRLGVVLE